MFRGLGLLAGDMDRGGEGEKEPLPGGRLTGSAPGAIFLRPLPRLFPCPPLFRGLFSSMSEHPDAYSPELTVTAAGRTWRLRRASDFDSLWESMTAEGRADADEHIPYWTELWPASLALADWIAAKKALLAGRRCLDMGCGLGLTALAAASVGAKVLAMDYEEEALRFARENARLNGVPEPAWAVMDWRRPAVAPASLDFVWGGDIMYERRFADPVLRFCGHVLRPGGLFWVAEPGRQIYEAFLAALPGRGWRGRRVYRAMVPAIYAQVCAADVTIWELTRV